MKRPIPLGFRSPSASEHLLRRSREPRAALQRCDPRLRIRGSDHRPRLCDWPTGYTLVEILVATVLSLMLLGAVVQMFGKVSNSITDSRAMLETADRLRLAATRLQQDLAGITVTMSPPRKPENNEGYFEYIEGPVGVVSGAQPEARNTETSAADSTVGDFDDILMFTTRSTGRPFVGKIPVGVNPTGTIQSDIAEVAWFLRGRTLHRRVLLVAPSAFASATSAGYYLDHDVSGRLDGTGNVVPNTLGDLTKRENRFAHWGGTADTFPFSACRWGQVGLPTLRECSASGWTVDHMPASAGTKSIVDFWANGTSATTDALPWADNVVMATGTRVADDVILTNVIGFDVKAWDPDAGMYVDLGYTGAGTGRFSHSGAKFVDRANTATLLSGVYDTWSTHYESEGANGLTGAAGRAINGFDDAGNNDDGTSESGNGIVDDAKEMITSPPYPYPLRGIQVKIRVFEPDSRQIREVTVVQDFLPQ